MASTTIVMDFSISQSADCKTLTFNDLTGAYDANTNPTGYKAADLSDADRITTITITLPDDTIKVITFTGVSPTLITDNPEVDYVITSTTLGITSGSEAITKLDDGLYKIKYQVKFGNGYIKFVTKTILLSCQVRCCIEALFDTIAESQDVCDSNDVTNALFSYSLLKSMQFEAQCGSNKTKINSILESLQAICDSVDCNCGC